MKKRIFFFIALAFSIALWGFRIDTYITKYFIKKLYLFKFYRAVDQAKINEAIDFPLEYYSEISEEVLKKYLLKSPDFFLVSHIVCLHDKRFVPFFTQRSAMAKDSFSKYLGYGAIWLTEFGDFPINSTDEYLNENNRFTAFISSAKKIISLQREKNPDISEEDEAMAYAIAAADLGWDMLFAYEKSQKQFDLELAYKFFVICDKIYPTENYESLWGMGKTLYLKAQKIFDFKQKEFLLKQADHFFELAGKINLPAEAKEYFLRDHAEIRKELKQLLKRACSEKN